MESKKAIVPFPRSRLGRIPVRSLGAGHHTSVALIEIDITKARRRMGDAGEGDRIALLGWLASQCAVSLSRHPHITAPARTVPERSRDVHVLVRVPRRLGEHVIPFPLLLRDAATRSAEQLADQIALGHNEPLREEEVLFGYGGTTRSPLTAAFRTAFFLLPKRTRRWAVNRALRKSTPERDIKLPGRTVSLISMGGGSKLRGWFIPKSATPIAIGVGSVHQKAAVINGRIEPRQMLQLSVLLDGATTDDSRTDRWLSSLIKGMEGAFPRPAHTVS